MASAPLPQGLVISPSMPLKCTESEESQQEGREKRGGGGRCALRAQARTLSSCPSPRAARTATATASRPGPRGAEAEQAVAFPGETHPEAASARTKPAVPRPEAPRGPGRRAPRFTGWRWSKLRVGRPAPVTARDRGTGPAPFGPCPLPRSRQPGRGLGSAEPRPLGSTRLFSAEGAAADLKRHFKGSSILI